MSEEVKKEIKKVEEKKPTFGKESKPRESSSRNSESSEKSSSRDTRPSRFNRGDSRDRQNRRFAARKRRGEKGGQDRRRGSKSRNNKKNNRYEDDAFESRVIDVRRVTRVVKGGKRMRFSALVVVGDRQGKIGFGIMKGGDFQDSVSKATRKAKANLIQIKINDNNSVDFPSLTKFKACQVYLKPAPLGTGVIAGGFLRPVLELAGIKNVYSKIIGSRNKTSGTQAAVEALANYIK